MVPLGSWLWAWTRVAVPATSRNPSSRFAAGLGEKVRADGDRFFMGYSLVYVCCMFGFNNQLLAGDVILYDTQACPKMTFCKLKIRLCNTIHENFVFPRKLFFVAALRRGADLQSAGSPNGVRRSAGGGEVVRCGRGRRMANPRYGRR